MTRIRGAVLMAAIMSAGVVVGADVAAAQPQSAEEQAKAKFLAGKQSFRLGEFDEAISLWKEAYRLKDNPAFLFNIGLAYREKGDLPKAVQFLENYLKDAPANAANRTEVEARVKELKKLIEDQKAAARRPPNEPTDGDGATGTPVVTDTSTDPGTDTGTGTTETGVGSGASMGLGEEPRDGGGGGGGMRIAGLAAGGVGVALIGTGVFFGLKASSAQKDVQAAVDMGAVWTDELDQQDQDGRSAATLSTITLSVGAAAVVTGGVLFYLGLRKGKTESSSLSIVPHASGVTVIGSF